MWLKLFLLFFSWTICNMDQLYIYSWLSNCYMVGYFSWPICNMDHLYVWSCMGCTDGVHPLYGLYRGCTPIVWAVQRVYTHCTGCVQAVQRVYRPYRLYTIAYRTYRTGPCFGHFSDQMDIDCTPWLQKKFGSNVSSDQKGLDQMNRTPLSVLVLH